MTRMVTVMVLPGGAAPIRTEKIDGDDYRALNTLVEGNLGTCSLPPTLRRAGLYAFCDDDAMVREHKPAPNRFAEHLGHFALLGPIVIVRTDVEGETLGLRKREVEYLEMYLAAPPTNEAKRAAALERQWWSEHPSGIAVWSPSEGWQDL